MEEKFEGKTLGSLLHCLNVMAAGKMAGFDLLTASCGEVPLTGMQPFAVHILCACFHGSIL